MRGRVVGVLCLLLIAAAPIRVGATNGELPLGRPGLPETRTTTQLAPGVTYTRIERGFRSNDDFFTVDVAFVESESEAEQIAADLEASGYDARTAAIERAPDDPRPGPSGYVVRSGRFTTQQEADARTAELVAQGYSSARTVYTAQTGDPTTGPFVVHVLEILPDVFEGTVEAELATEIVPEREKLTDMARRTGALAGINAGYFVIGEQDGTPGDLAGISVIDGDLVSEAVNGRTSLIVRPHDGASVATLESDIRATVDRRHFLVDGVNREPGEIRSCGGVGGDVPTQDPKHDFTCADTSELIAFTEAFGPATEAGPGAEVVVDRTGRVIAVRDARGGSIPPGSTVLSATGEVAAELLGVAHIGDRARVKADVTEGGRKIAVADGLGIVNGGPLLVEDGNARITAFAEGFVWLDDPSFYYRFGLFRHPRTIAGVRADGKILLVAIDGRQFDYSVGASFAEEAGVMRALGAIEALNLDGGGSTTLVIDGELVGRPSDAAGERPIGDALLLFD
jgi:hypothetical protein